MNLIPKFQKALDAAVDHLRANLADNLYALMLYGSAVRGGLDPETSDLNLLIILEASTAAAHKVIREVTGGPVSIEPFVVERGGMPRATRVFALKFLSIQRNYRVLHGADPLRDLEVPPELVLWLTEQELRNLRMRTVQAFVTLSRPPARYRSYLLRHKTRMFIVLSDVLRCGGIEVPRPLDDRIPGLARTFGVEEAPLRRLLSLEREERDWTEEQAVALHAGLMGVFSGALTWMEKRWPKLPL